MLSKRLQSSAAGVLVGTRARGESCSVNAIVDTLVDKIGELRVVGFDFFWEKIDGFILGKVVKHVVEHAADVVLAIVYNPLCFRVPENWHSHPALITRIGGCVRFAQELEAVDRISGFERRAGRDLAGCFAKAPAQLVSNRTTPSH